MLGILGLFMAAMVWLGIRRIQGYLTLCGDVSLGVATRVSSLILESVVCVWPRREAHERKSLLFLAADGGCPLPLWSLLADGTLPPWAIW